MAKPKSAPTAAALATVAARDILTKAREAEKAKSTDATKKAVADAEVKFKAALATENRERFIRVAGGRVKSARVALKNIGKCAVPRSYTYDESDVAKAETALNDAVKQAIAALRNALTKGAGAAKAADDFSF